MRKEEEGESRRKVGQMRSFEVLGKQAHQIFKKEKKNTGREGMQMKGEA